MIENKQKSDLATKIAIISELGYIDDSEESRKFRAMYAELDENRRARIDGMIYGATAAMHTEQMKERK